MNTVKILSTTAVVTANIVYSQNNTNTGKTRIVTTKTVNILGSNLTIKDNSKNTAHARVTDQVTL